MPNCRTRLVRTVLQCGPQEFVPGCCPASPGTVLGQLLPHSEVGFEPGSSVPFKPIILFPAGYSQKSTLGSPDPFRSPRPAGVGSSCGWIVWALELPGPGEGEGEGGGSDRTREPHSHSPTSPSPRLTHEPRLRATPTCKAPPPAGLGAGSCRGCPRRNPGGGSLALG